MSTCNWPLGNGQELECHIYDTNTNWNNVAGVYIFAYRINPTHWHALYVGKAVDFKTRPMPPSHERWNEAIRLGATHIHAAVVPQAAMREKLEEMLIQTLQPEMNVQLR
jgi:excinuclease UvrABC nuclease subunit